MAVEEDGRDDIFDHTVVWSAVKIQSSQDLANS